MHPYLNAFAGRLVTRAQQCAAEPDGGIPDAEFNRLALELAGIQRRLNPAFAAWCDRRSGGARDGDFAEWRSIPATPTDAFKDLPVTCLEPEERTIRFESSGTTAAERSRNFHDADSVRLYETLAALWFSGLNLDRTGAGGAFRMAALTPGPELAPHSSLARMFGTFVRRFGAGGSGFFGKVDGAGAWEVDPAAIESALASDPGRPWFVLATAFNLVHWLDSLESRGVRLRLPAGSRVLETGGYKGRSRVLSKQELTGRIGALLGVAEDGVVTEYGMCELASQAYGGPGAGAGGLLRFPPWVRARTVSPETGAETAPGEPGVVQVYDLANVASVVAVQTGDLGAAESGALRLLGRVREAPARGCSLLAA